MAAVIPLAACGPQAGAPERGITPFYNPETRRLERVTYDRNGDGRIDATTYMDGAVVTRAELDEDFDGTIDRWEHFITVPPAPGAARGEAVKTVLERVEVSTRPDGRVNRWERYDDGALRHVEEDTNADGRVDKWETWEDGALSIVAMDTRGDGRPDRRLLYSRDGGEPRLEIDSSGTGTFASVTPAGRPLSTHSPR